MLRGVNPLSTLAHRFGVQPAERALLGWAGLCLIGMGAAAFALLNTAETLFLKRVGVEALPLVLLASAGLLVVTTGIAGRLASQDPPRWLPRVLLFMVATLVPFVLLADAEQPLVFAAFVLVARQVLALGMLSFWLAMGSLVPPRRAKQLFAPLAAGVTIGGIVGSFGSEPIARVLGIGGLIGLCAASLLCASLAARRLRAHGTRRLAGSLGRVGSSAATANTGVAQLLRNNQLFRLLAVAMLCGGALSPALYFEFSSVVDAATVGPDAEQALLGIYSQFRGWLNVAMLVVQLWLSTALYRRIGLPLSMALLPLAYVMGFGWLSIQFVLIPAFTSFGSARLAEDGIADSAARVLYNLFPDNLRARANGLLSGPVNRLGGVLGNLLVLAAVAGGASHWIGWGAMPIAGLWLGSALLLWRVYPDLLLRASAEHGFAGADVDKEALVDPATFRELAAHLVDDDPQVCRAAFELVKDGEPRQVVSALAAAIHEAPPQSRAILVDGLDRLAEPLAQESIRSPEAVQALAETLRASPAPPSEEHATLLRTYARLTHSATEFADSSLALLQRELGSPDAPVRLAAIAELCRRGASPPGLPDLDRNLGGALTAPETSIRRAARKELRAILIAPDRDAGWEERLALLAGHLEQRVDRLETVEALREVARVHRAATSPLAESAMRYTDDRDPRVRGALLSLAGFAGLEQESARMVEALGSRSREEVVGARDGLLSLGIGAAGPLLVGLGFGGPRRREAIVSVLRDLEVDAATLDSLLARQLGDIRQAAAQRAALDERSGAIAGLLRRRLEERITEGLGATLDLLSALHHDPRIADMERQLRRTPGGRAHDLLLEAIDSLLGREERAVIVPLLEAREDGQWRRQAGVANEAHDGAAETLASLRESPDETTRLLAAAIALEAASVIGDPPAMPSSMDLAVRLQEFPAFDRLNTAQLLTLAGLVQEQKIADGERLYREGEEGACLYCVLEGEVELRRGSLTVEAKGAGSLLGELAAVDGSPRAEDTFATRPTRLLRVDRSDLLRMFDEAPGLALGFAQYLSARVRQLEDRLEEISPQVEDDE